MSETAMQRPAVVLGDDNMITLPDEIARQGHPADRFVVVPQGDTLIDRHARPAVDETT